MPGPDWFQKKSDEEFAKGIVFGFLDGFRFLSNYQSCEIELDGEKFQSTENAYQCAKFKAPEIRELFLYCSPAKARALGQDFDIETPDWLNKRVEIMKECIDKKFNIPELRNMLLSTHNLTLVEGNYWGDTFWGVSSPDKGRTWIGENMLGKILMEKRKRLQEAIKNDLHTV